ncbi:hypothetical protein [Biostraticola tofi]|uniref:hypothetical protein n=1 Tax=Biostraticola tofi TaxID=466109 RepID=UPI00105262DC|nr:hypothetical protein [Biostraticola tofi]
MQPATAACCCWAFHAKKPASIRRRPRVVSRLPVADWAGMLITATALRLTTGKASRRRPF